MNQKVRARQLMYVQQLTHLKIPLDDLPGFLNKLKTIEWAYIVHDKDKHHDGTSVTPHIHIVLKYMNPQVIDNIAQKFGDKPERFEVWKGKINNAYSYLLHRTDEARDKCQYSVKDVVASFDFEQRIKDIEKNIVKQKKALSSKAILQLIDTYAQSDILDHESLIEKIGITEFAKKKTLIDNIDHVKLQKKHQQFLKDFEGQQMTTYWLYGPAGVGKTTIAKVLTDPNNTAILGSSRDYFQAYRGENTVIINDLRPNEFSYSDLLKFLDTTENDKMGPRRYHDIPLNLKEVYITTPYSPEDFYDETYISNRHVDTFEQLERRIKSIPVTIYFLELIQKLSASGYLEIVKEGFKYEEQVTPRSILERVEEFDRNLPF